MIPGAVSIELATDPAVGRNSCNANRGRKWKL
jgi:hypothetical protein